jgi:hypothetical protein
MYTSFTMKAVIIIIALISAYAGIINAADYTDEDLARAIFYAEGGANTQCPYGIMTHYKTTSPKQACLNTIAHARRDWDGTGDFIDFLSRRYCPLDHTNWARNVHAILERRRSAN